MQTLWFETALLPEGWAKKVRISVQDGRIGSVEAGVDPAGVGEHHPVAVPGLCNLHSHAFQRGMAGLTEYSGPADDDFWTWRELMYRFLDHLGPEDVQAIAAQAYVEMLQSGFTRVGEFHYLHHDPAGRPYDDVAEMVSRIAAAADETGIGLTLLPVYYAQGGFGGAPPTPGQRRFLNDPERFARLVEMSGAAIASLQGAVLGVAPHSLRAARAEELPGIVALAPDGPVHIHAAEQTREVDDCLAWSGQRPVEWLLDHAGVDARWCLVHATHMTPGETARLAASGAVAGLCPITEANLGDGVFPARDYLGAGGAFGIGTDSNVLIDAAEELRLMEYAQRLAHRGRNLLSARDRPSVGATLHGGAQAGGARALGVGAGLRPGAWADLVTLDLNHPSLAGRSGDQLLDAWIFAAGKDAVACVWRAGRKVVEDGRARGAQAIARRYRAVLKRVLTS